MEQLSNWKKFQKWNKLRIGTNFKFEFFLNLNKFQNLNILKFECSENYNMKEEIKQKRNKK
jgi:hypothetical protein